MASEPQFFIYVLFVQWRHPLLGVSIFRRNYPTRREADEMCEYFLLSLPYGAQYDVDIHMRAAHRPWWADIF